MRTCIPTSGMIGSGTLIIAKFRVVFILSPPTRTSLWPDSNVFELLHAIAPPGEEDIANYNFFEECRRRRRQQLGHFFLIRLVLA